MQRIETANLRISGSASGSDGSNPIWWWNPMEPVLTEVVADGWNQYVPLESSPSRSWASPVAKPIRTGNPNNRCASTVASIR